VCVYFIRHSAAFSDAFSSSLLSSTEGWPLFILYTFLHLLLLGLEASLCHDDLNSLEKHSLREVVSLFTHFGSSILATMEGSDRLGIEAIFEALQHASSQNPDLLRSAEQRLHSWETRHGFYIALMVSSFQIYELSNARNIK
jgi:hypothetical protein